MRSDIKSERYVFKQDERYTAEIRFGGAGGASYKLYVSMLDRNISGCDDVIGRDYRKRCPWAEIISFQ